MGFEREPCDRTSQTNAVARRNPKNGEMFVTIVAKVPAVCTLISQNSSRSCGEAQLLILGRMPNW